MADDRIDVVVVTFNSAKTLADCLQSVVGDAAVARVVVVDNCSTDSSPEIAAAQGAHVIRADRNGGFGAGCNLGVRSTRSPAVLLLNPDAVVEPGTASGLRDLLNSHPNAAAVGSEVFGIDGEREPVRRRFPAIRRALLEPGIAARMDERWYSRRAPAGGETDWLSAACLLVRREAFDAVGGFDETYFLYSEETDLCARWRARGWSVYWAPGMPARHEGAASTKALPGQGKAAWVDGYLRYARTHHRHPRLLQLGIVIGFTGRALAWTALHRPERRRRYAAAARRAVRG